MVDNKTDFFYPVDNFGRFSDYESISIISSKSTNSPKVTIAIPTYKRVKLLKEALDSAINQSNYTDFDIIVVDNDPERDCETERLMASYEFPKISYYKNSQNLGMAGNWNRLFSLAAGEFVVMLHDDDLLLPNFLEKSMDVLSKNKHIDLLKPKFYIFEEYVKEEDTRNLGGLDGALKEVNTFSFYAGCFIGAPTGAIFRREAVIKVGGFNPDFQPSLDFCFYVLFSRFYAIYHLNEYLVLYRLAENETFKVNTMHGFVKVDYYLIRFILRSYFIPDFVAINYLSFVTFKRIYYFKTELAPEFSFDLESIDIREISSIEGKLSSKFLRFVDYCIRFGKYLNFSSKK